VYKVHELRRGILIVIEGIDGAGKTTQASILADKLTEEGYAVTSLKEPTDGKWGQEIRKLATNGRTLPPDKESKLFLEDRREDVEFNIKPALALKRIVVMDRYYYSNIAYQGALGIDPENIRRLNEAFAPVPDVVIVLDVAPSIGQFRLVNGRKDKPNHFEKIDYLEKVRMQFQRMEHLKNVQPVDGSRTIDAVSESVISVVHSILKAVGESDETGLVEGNPVSART
jgi:dTMP kinase